MPANPRAVAADFISVSLMVRVLLVAVLSLFGFAAPLLAQDEKDTDLRTRAEAWVGRQAFGVYMVGKKVGFGALDIKITEFRDKPALHTSFDMEMRITLFGETSKMSSKEESWYSFEGDGPLLRVETNDTEDGTTTRKTLQAHDDGWEVVTRVGDREQKRMVAAPKTTLALEMEIDRWLESQPETGSKHHEWMVDLDKKDINQKTALEYVGSERRLQSGVPVKVHIVKMKMDGVAVTAKFLNKNVFLEASMGEFMRIVAEDERIARRMDTKVVDFTMHLSVPIKKDMGEESGDIDRLSTEVSGQGDFEFPQSRRQRFELREGKPGLLYLRRDYRIEKATPLSVEERKRWSEQQPGIESEHERIRKRARKIAGQEKDVVKVAHSLQHWVYENLDATAAKNSNSALTILEQRAGDCTEHARLFVALARAVGLPAREVGGLLYANLGQPLFVWHAWAEVHDGRQWVSVDPAWDQVFVDAAHIRFDSGTDDLAWINTIGSLKLRVVDFAKR